MLVGVDYCAQVWDALRRAGWPEWAIPIMVAISRAETGGTCSPNATAATPQEYSVGPFQINLKAHPWVDEACARDPFCAAQAALRIYKSQGFDAWTVWKTGAWRRWFEPVSQATPTIPQTLTPTDAPWIRYVVLAAAMVVLVVGISAWRGRA